MQDAPQLHVVVVADVVANVHADVDVLVDVAGETVLLVVEGGVPEGGAHLVVQPQPQLQLMSGTH